MKKNKYLCMLAALIITFPACSQNFKTDDINNPLGTAYIEKEINKTEGYIKTNNYEEAEKLINSIKDWVFDATEHHTELFMTLRKVEKAQNQAEIERKLAIKFASFRDKVLFTQAQIFIHKGETRKAVDNLVEIVRSQPDSELGFQSYNKLIELGFTYGVDSIEVKSKVIEHAE